MPRDGSRNQRSSSSDVTIGSAPLLFSLWTSQICSQLWTERFYLFWMSQLGDILFIFKVSGQETKTKSSTSSVWLWFLETDVLPHLPFCFLDGRRRSFQKWTSETSLTRWITRNDKYKFAHFALSFWQTNKQQTNKQKHMGENITSLKDRTIIILWWIDRLDQIVFLPNMCSNKIRTLSTKSY